MGPTHSQKLDDVDFVWIAGGRDWTATDGSVAENGRSAVGAHGFNAGEHRKTGRRTFAAAAESTHSRCSDYPFHRKNYGAGDNAERNSEG